MPENDSGSEAFDLANAAASMDPNDRTSDASSEAKAADTPTPMIKDHPAVGEPVAIPAHLTGDFPPDTQVVKHESGQLVASIPVAEGEGNGWYRFVVEAGHGIDRLARLVAAFRGGQSRGE